MQSLLSNPRVWDTSQQAIFNRRTAGREGENTEKGTLFLCLLRKFFPHWLLQRNALYAKKEQKKNAAICKDYNASENPYSILPDVSICPLFRLLKFLLQMPLQSVCHYRSYHQGERRAAAALYLFGWAYLKETGLRIYCNGA